MFYAPVRRTLSVDSFFPRSRRRSDVDLSLGTPGRTRDLGHPLI